MRAQDAAKTVIGKHLQKTENTKQLEVNRKIKIP